MHREKLISYYFSGFTALCEKYADMVKIDSACGTDKLTATLNNYIGKIVDCMFGIPDFHLLIPSTYDK